MMLENVRLDRYQIERLIGGGGMADVYRATEIDTGRLVALKFPHRGEGFWEVEKAGANLQRELSKLDPRVPQVHEIRDDGDLRFVAMEFVEGEDLFATLERGPLEWREAVRIAIELCGVLETARTCPLPIDGRAGGIVHGDIKPRNVRLLADGRVKVLDFGIARALREVRAETRNVFASVPYSSKQRLERGTVDHLADLWAVAVVLYECVCGRRPFEAPSDAELRALILSGVRPAPPTAAPRALAAVLQKALEPALEDRYLHARDLAADLAAVLAGTPTVAEAQQLAREGVRFDPHATRRNPAAVPPAPAGPDPHATRGRAPGPPAAPGGLDPDATRRSVPRPAPALPPPIAASAAPDAGRAAPPATSRPARARALTLRRVLVVGAIVLAANEAQVMVSAETLRSSLPARARADAATVWAQYRGLQRRSLGIGVLALRWRLRSWLVTQADDLIARYRSDTPTIRENQWRTAAALLERASQLREDSKVSARLAYCRAHLDRIEGRAEEARAGFERAASLWKSWPDPHLGLAQLHAYSRRDPERTREAVERAQHADYRIGEREVAFIADAHRLRAERRWAGRSDAVDPRGRYRLLQKIDEDLRDARRYYESIPAFGDVQRHLRKVADLSREVAIEMDALAGSSS